ncbi:hypoxanthine-guanine phosphoribosyltransferase [Ascosphaera pollenicola]|nr:hypoxanthine-guanine phosphoribosyltransferase [Ascosphaera pollenicola]
MSQKYYVTGGLFSYMLDLDLDLILHHAYSTSSPGQVHKLCRESAQFIVDNFKPNLMIAIGGGGYIPARILRSFLRQPGQPNIPIQAIGLSLYENLGTDPDVESPGTNVTRTQWLDLSSLEMANLIGKHVLIVDEVDDTRTTLEYAVRELQKDVEVAQKQLGREGEKTTFSVFVLHNKDKAKKGTLPQEMLDNGNYLAAVTTGDYWICYPWESEDIDEHDELAKKFPMPRS